LRLRRHLHCWARFEAGSCDLAFASITWGSDEGNDTFEEVTPPSASELEAPGGTSREALAKKYEAGELQKLDEIYIDFDMSDPPGSGSDCMCSYGEYVPTLENLDFEPFLERATSRAHFHHQTLPEPKAPFAIVRREWWTLTSPNLVAIHIYYGV
jgi:hypothetical protein